MAPKRIKVAEIAQVFLIYVPMSNQTSEAMMVTTALHFSGGLQRSIVIDDQSEGFCCPLGTDWVGNADLVM